MNSQVDMQSEYSKVRQENESLLLQRSQFSKTIERVKNDLALAQDEKIQLEGQQKKFEYQQEEKKECLSGDLGLKERLQKAEEDLAKFKQQAESRQTQIDKLQEQMNKVKS